MLCGAAHGAGGGDVVVALLPAIPDAGLRHAWLEHLAAGAALIRLSVPLQRWAGYLPWAVPLGVLLVALWLYMDIRHGRKGFRAWVHRVLMAAAVMFYALVWTLRAGILTEQMTL